VAKEKGTVKLSSGLGTKVTCSAIQKKGGIAFGGGQNLLTKKKGGVKDPGVHQGKKNLAKVTQSKPEWT